MSLPEMANQGLPRRQVLSLLGTGALGAMLAACGGSASSSQSGPYKGKFVIVSVGEQKQNDPLIQAIQKAHPGVQVVWRNFPSEQFTSLFSAASVAHDQIDIMDLNGQDLRRYAVSKQVLDLSNFPQRDRFTDVAQQTYTINDKLWALPRGGSGGFTFFYNKKLLAKAGFTKEPATYDDLKQLAPELKKLGAAPFTHAGKNIYLWPVWFFWAYAQTTKNQSIEKTLKTLAGDQKFTDPEVVAALELIYRYAQDKMFIDSVNSLDDDGAMANFTQAKGAFFYTHASVISTYRNGSFPALDMSLTSPLLAVNDTTIKRQMPGGTGNALCVYSKIDPARKELAMQVIDLMTNDTWSKWASDQGASPASCNKNVKASDDPLAVKYADGCAPNQTTYLDWYWPPEITAAFQQNIQGLVTGTLKPNAAAQAIEKVMDGLRADGYTFAS
jgi:raffinose/stachyose/melibiose transport system substrate-binding protein